jgi:uridylate kinase
VAKKSCQQEVRRELKKNNIILKLGGEAFAGRNENISSKKLAYIVDEILSLRNKFNVGIVPGGGNIYRGKENVFSRIMVKRDVKCAVFSSFRIEKFTYLYTVDDADAKMNQGYVNIYVGGTSNPFFSTDSLAAIRAVELNSKLILKATKVDGVYNNDPLKFKNAKKFNKLTYDKAIKLKVGVIDLCAIDLCSQFKMPIVVFNFFKKGNLQRAASFKTGSIIK